ncbi:MAG TPA: TonB-dependent receptor [Pyrinomonadaceae bacterium]|nr:TonB-dependent receptor [Pyrinomonadaceae bacterium]
MRNRTGPAVWCTRIRQSLLALCWLAVVHSVAAQQQSLTKISGTVSDPAGAAIEHASVEFAANGSTVRTVTDSSGSFELLSAQPYGTLLVTSPGFNSVRVVISKAASVPLQIRLDPANVIERILVTANDERIPATPASQFVLSQREINLAGALTIDDVLRQVPGFSLFRRSGSLTANPTSQGVSLRGVGANGASRALVLLDGVPLNSPFGGWVYWNRLPRVSVKNIQVYNGATSDLYGSGALGGVINIRSVKAPASFLDLEMSGGNKGTAATSFSGGKVCGDWGVTVAGQALRTGGYVLVPENQRGEIDTAAGTSDLSGSLILSRRLGAEGHAFARLSSLGESRRNGTPLQLNDTRIWSIDLGADWSRLSVRLYGSSENFNQNFSAVAADRNSESLTNRQRNPSQQAGFAFQWRQQVGQRQTISAGIEGRDVRGHSAERTFNNSRITAFVDAGGRQRSFGVFVADSMRLGSWLFTAGARVDRWRNYGGFSNRIPVTGAPSLNAFADRSETAFSPRVSLLKRLNRGVSVSASMYRAFRAPTLNELYRNFRVGNVVTNANAGLRAERLTGGDAGIGVQTFGERLFVRTNIFWNEINDSVANVTLSTIPALITRQRQNLGAIRARGIEVSATTKLTRHWEISGEYLLSDSTVLEGLRVPQVPRNQFNFQVSYANEKWLVGTQGRFVGKQFDDDQNTLPLARFFTLDAEASRAVSERVRLFVAIQNLTGTRYQISSTPVFTVGPPVLVRVGARESMRKTTF